MSEVVFSKKQITPLMEKYKINSDNAYFKGIITMFQDQTNYQIWAIKAVFGNNVKYDTIRQIKNWADNNQSEIQNLTKSNIVAYKTESEISQLLGEMRGLDMLSAVKSTINKFNTAQRELLRSYILKGITDATKVLGNKVFKKWYELFKSMEMLPQHKKEKLISLASAINDIAFLEKHISDALQASYDWNREDMLAFMHHNASDCKVMFDENNVVVINVPSFSSSKKMCGNGRTAWCITREDRYFRQYVIEPGNAHQYMLFNFNHPENHELAHIGFTVRDGYGITNAHSTKNQSMTGSGCSINGRTVNITTALSEVGVPKGIYIKLKPMTAYKWGYDEVLNFIKHYPNEYAISVNENGRIIVRVLTQDGLSRLIGHTLIDTRSMAVNKDNKIYVLFDFNLGSNDDNSVVVLQYGKDTWGTDALRSIRDAYNGDITKSGIMAKLGIPTDRYLNRESIAPTILLHKLIEEDSEKEAIELIVKNGEGFDVNFEFNQRTPIFSAINKKMYNLFKTIVSHKKFDCSSCDGFGESLLQNLLYNYKYDGITTPEEDKATKKMIDIILSSENFDFNVQNINLDTAVNIACERTELNWVAEALISNPKVNINVVNDFNCAALGNALRCKNLDALKMLGTRPDLEIRAEDKELAEKNGIKLEDYINPQPMTTVSVETTSKKESSNTSDLYSELFARAFARVREGR